MSRPWRSTVKSSYVTLAHRSGRVLEAGHLVSGQPPPHDRRLRHWMHTLAHVYDSRALDRFDVPWWTYRAIDVVETWLATRPDARVFEFGTGASTAWLARRGAQVHSVEHDAEFLRSFEPRLSGFSNVVLQVEAPVPSASPRAPSGRDEYSGLDFSAYVSTIDEAGDEFDMIVVDGRARAACLERAIPHLAADGLIVFDNSRRQRYREAIVRSGLHEQALRGLTPTLPYPEQTSLLYHDRG